MTEAERYLMAMLAEESGMFIQDLEDKVFHDVLRVDARRLIRATFAGKILGICRDVAQMTANDRAALTVRPLPELIEEFQRHLVRNW